MPELPEVETTKRGLAPQIVGKTIHCVVVRQPRLRWPINLDLNHQLSGASVQTITRRAKYLLFAFQSGSLLIHLGMSGHLCIVDAQRAPSTHAHVDFVFKHGKILRYIDPRRFGAILWLGADYLSHPLLHKLGPEPFAAAFHGSYLFERSRGKTRSIKNMLMDQQIVTGVGNIYATEALFAAKIHPARPAGELSLADYQRLCTQVKQILEQAVAQGGTTLRDFAKADGKPGYFQQQLRVYGRNGLPCVHCQQTLEMIKLNNRASVYCRVCQPQSP